MKKILVVLAGIYLIAIAVLSGIFAVAALFFPSPDKVLPQGFAYFGVLFYLLLAVWLFSTGIGLILRKNWSRISLFVMSGFALLTGILLFIAAMFFMPVPDKDLAQMQNFSLMKLIMMTVSGIFFVAIPLYFLIFFSRPAVRSLFLGGIEEGAKGSGRPFGIILVAVFTLIGAVFTTLFVFFPMLPKVPVLGDFMLSGIWLKIYFLIFSIVGFYIGIGLLRLQKGAWVTYVILHSITTLVALFNLLTITEARILEITPQLQDSSHGMSLTMYKMFGGLSLILPVVFLLYVISKRRLFFNKGISP